MTTKKDNFQNRVAEIGQGLEDTQGVPQDGMQDPTGEFPKREYNYGIWSSNNLDAVTWTLQRK